MPPARKQPTARRTWVLVLAYALGLAVLLGHLVTLSPPRPSGELLSFEWQDLTIHALMLLSFTLAYRFSYRYGGAPANWASLWVCGLWGALCETLQYWIPTRDFSPLELAVNVLTPVVTIGVFALVGKK